MLSRMEHGIYLLKPINNDEFRHAVALCFEQRRLLDENQELKRLINLFQTSQTIANCLDFERIYSLMVDSLAKEVGVSRALGYFADESGTLELKEMKGFDEEHATALGELIFSMVDVGKETRTSILLTDLMRLSSICEKMSIKNAMLLLVRSKRLLQGIVILFNDSEKVFPRN